MSTIEGEALAALIAEGLAATPQRLREGHEEELIRQALSGQLAASTVSLETQLFVRAVSLYRPLILDTAMEKLLRCRIISIPAPICSARAMTWQGTPTIVVFDGLLDLVVAIMEMSYAVRELPRDLEHVFPHPDFPAVSTNAWAEVIFLRLINRFLTDGEPPPDLRRIISSPTIERDIQHAFVGAAWWFLLHELGHIELGHGRFSDGQFRLAISEGLVVDEELSVFQQQEFDADAFVFDCLTDEGKKAYYVWTSMALGAMMMVESLYLRPRGTHPLSVNRLIRAHELSQDVDEIAADLKAREHLVRHGAAHVDIHSSQDFIRSTGGTPFFEHWSRDDLMTALSGLKGFYLDRGLDFESLFHSTSRGWRALFLPVDEQDR
jgi:hypothetical protein